MIELDGLYEALKEFYAENYDSPYTKEEFQNQIFMESEFKKPIGIAYSEMNSDLLPDVEIPVQVNIDTENLQSYVEVPEELEEFTKEKKIIIDNYADDEAMIEDIRNSTFDGWYEEGCWKLRQAIGDE